MVSDVSSHRLWEVNAEQQNFNSVAHPLHNLCRPERCNVTLSDSASASFQCRKGVAKRSFANKSSAFGGALCECVAAAISTGALHWASK